MKHYFEIGFFVSNVQIITSSIIWLFLSENKIEEIEVNSFITKQY